MRHKSMKKRLKGGLVKILYECPNCKAVNKNSLFSRRKINSAFRRSVNRFVTCPSCSKGFRRGSWKWKLDGETWKAVRRVVSGEEYKLIRKCVSCGKLYRLRSWHVLQIYCSHKCSNKNRRILQVPPVEDLKFYMDNNYTVRNMALVYKVTTQTIYNWMRKYGL